MRPARQRVLAAGFLLAAAVALWPPAAGSQAATSDAPAPIVIDARGPGHPFPHFWEQMFGSGRARLAMRASYLEDLATVHAATGFRYVRAHGILDDDVGLYSEDAQGRPVYNFSYVDQIYDGLLAHGVRPFVELSFMPRQLAASPVRQAFWYHPYVAPPRDWQRWSELIAAFARHLVARYGIAEVSQWYFEVWNEPNLDFWAGAPKQATYFHLYDVTARALKSVSPLLRVGGPATAQAAWVTPFLRHCAVGRVPVDFVSTHVYGNDSAANVFGVSETISRRDLVARAVRKVHDQVAASPFPQLPIIFSEYNASYKNEPAVTDSAFMGPWLAETISACDGMTKMLAYWTFSDVFEEQGVVRTPFYGGFGLIAEDHIPKPVFNAFALLHRLGETRVPAASDSVLATRRADGSLALAVWNYAPAYGGGAPHSFRLAFEGLPPGSRALIWIVDPQHGSPLPAWRAMGSPANPTREQIAELRRAAVLPPPSVRALDSENPLLTLTLAPKALALVEIEH
ncbi:MAG TPA: glycosyl hydrolase family 39 [Terriglobales bacterium]|nr:glycosyl hydrolase family 39 [Terriglobales bacterium]